MACVSCEYKHIMRAIKRFIYDSELACTFIRTEEISSITGVMVYTKPSSKNLKTKY
jgi:hypothetical protein